MEYVIRKHGGTYVAWLQHDGVPIDEDTTLSAEADHPVAALRALLKKEEG